MTTSLIDSVIAVKWARDRHLIPPDTPCKVAELVGGVSCVVLRLDCEGSSIVIKQALPELRVAETWKSDPDRLVVEAAFMKVMQDHLPQAHIPRILCFDPEINVLAMETVDSTLTWKQQMFNGISDLKTAFRVGEIAALIHALPSTLPDEQCALFEDGRHFEDLRLKAYFEFAGDRLPNYKDFMYDLAQYHRQARTALAHGDFTPKNILITEDGPVLLDHEVAHLGCGSFDTASILNHIFLKTASGFLDAVSANQMAEAFLSGYENPGGIRGEMLLPTLAGLLVARVVGKSPVEYHTKSSRQAALDAAEAIISGQISSVYEVFNRL